MSFEVPTSYLLNYITTLGGTLETLYNIVALQGPLPLKEIRIRTDYRPGGAGEDHVKNGLNFLHTLDLVSLDHDGYSTTDKAAEGVDFRLKVVAGLRKASGDQGHFLELHDVLVREGRASVTDDELIAILNRKDFTTPGETDINPVKTGWWIRTCDYLGLVQQLNGRKRILVMPDPNLITAMLRELGANRKEVSVVDWLRHSETRYFCQLCADGTLHPGVAATLAELSSCNRLRLIYKDDAPPFQIAAGQSVTHLVLVKEESSDA